MAKRVCPMCAEIIDKKLTKCPICGHDFAAEKEDELTAFANSLDEKSDKKANVTSRAGAVTQTSLTDNGDKDNLGASSDGADANSNADGNVDGINVDTNSNADNDAAETNPNADGDDAQTTLTEGEEKAGAAEGAEEGGATGGDTATQPTPVRKRRKHKRKQQELPDVKKDENGELEIDTTDVTYFEGAKQPYGAKSARGERDDEKIQWWEIYKWADLYLARRKINKEVNKAARIEPTYIKHGVLLCLAILFGWMGAHNFYAKNRGKGWFVLSSLIIALIVVSVPAFKGVIDVSIGGGLGFVILIMWLSDVISIVMRRYKFRESKLKFIAKLNLETRKKLGKKYVNINEWFVPYENRPKKIKKQKI